MFISLISHLVNVFQRWMLSIISRTDLLLLGVASASFSSTAAVGIALLTWGSLLVLRSEATVFIDVFSRALWLTSLKDWTSMPDKY